MLFDCRLDSQRQIPIDLSYIVQIVWIPGPRNGNIQFLSQTIGVAFIPNPLGSRPCGGGHAEIFCEQRTIAGESGHCLVTRGVEHPTLQIQPVAYLQHCIHGFAFVVQVRNSHRMGAIARETGNGAFIIQNADRNAMPSKASRYT